MSYEEASNQAIADLENRQPSEESDNQTPVEGQENNNGPEQSKPVVEKQVGGDPSWNPQQWQLKFRDQVVVPKDRTHLINLAQQGYSYSQKMQELKSREEQLNAQRAQYDEYQKLDEAFAKNPQFREQILNWYQQSLTPGTPARDAANASENQSSIPPELLKEIQGLTEWKKQFEQFQEQQKQTQADAEIMGEVNDLKQKYARDDWDSISSNGNSLVKEVMKHAYELGGVSLETAYRDLMWDTHTKNAQVEGMKKAAESQKAAKAAGFVAGGKSKGAVPAPEINPASMGYGDIERLIRQEYGINS
jgi:hypothetical protein